MDKIDFYINDQLINSFYDNNYESDEIIETEEYEPPFVDPLIAKSNEIIKTQEYESNEIIEPTNLSSTVSRSYLSIKTPFGYIIFFR